MSERFLGMWQRSAQRCCCCATRRHSGASDRAESEPAPDACEDMLALLKLQSAWHAWCVRRQRFACVAHFCRRMVRWRKVHHCWAATVLEKYVQDLQVLCKALHGFRLDLAM